MLNVLLNAGYLITVTASASLSALGGKRIEYVLVTQEQRDVPSRLITSGSLLSGDVRNLHTHTWTGFTYGISVFNLLIFPLEGPYFNQHGLFDMNTL